MNPSRYVTNLDIPMKIISFSSLLFLLLTFSTYSIWAQIGQQNPWGLGTGGGDPVLEFDKKEFDFGIVPEGDTVRQMYSFRNTGTADLEILKVKTPCSCTTANWKPGPYKMGQSGNIEVVFTTQDKSGVQLKEIVVETNGSKRIEIIRLTGQVTANPDKHSTDSIPDRTKP